jgi:NAD(P)-dependent dehydrogenase (short-subunit alcohol dehydrogenase family)
VGTTGAVLVSGASKGIGRASALHLASLGWTVFAGVRQPADGAALRADGGERIVPVRLDLTDGETIERAVAEVAAAAPQGLSGLVNNAALAVAGPLEYLPADRLRHQFEVNVIGQLSLTRAALPLVRQAGGRIVNIGSIGGRLAGPFLGPYSASKFALRALTDALRLELRPWDIKVVLIEPGAVATPIWTTGIAAAETLRPLLGDEGWRRYGFALDRLRERAGARSSDGLPPGRVAEVVAKALTTADPRPRYLVGRDARLMALAARLPDRLRDRVIAGRVRTGPAGASRTG